MRIRPFVDGDDLKLNTILGDPQNPAAHMARSLFRADADVPVSRAVVAEAADDVLVGAAAVAQSPAHPTRAWAHVEVASTDERRGVGSALLSAAREAVVGTDLEGLPLRARVEPGTPGAQAAAAWGFSPLFRTRVVRIEAAGLGGLGADRLEDFEVTATGSVALTQAFGSWYAGVNRADRPAEMTIGQVNQRFLSEATGAHGAALMRRDGQITAFAVSFPAIDDGEDGATELTVGAVYDGSADGDAGEAVSADSPEFQAALEDTGALIARLSTDTPVVVEVTDEMPVLSTLIDGLVEAGKARVLYEYDTVATS
ncbi:histone acetyltransferase [Brevibacterium ravenspurgense]|uniref:histone acetyltransferase n=1 Tax=Brevibacterium ravenspurgense TaxID=479117 RepID=UPI001EF389FE|nr:histone acetyltransferase [Brevibacterium ravenspurgense]MCG7301132.1 histone acetyltransferase [Brevibacterium ravenspurgense]